MAHSTTRPETIHQARRCDIQKSRAIALGLCDRCAGQYAWGLQIGFTHSRPPCSTCAVIVAATPGEARPNGWVNMRLRNLGAEDTGQSPHAHASRFHEAAMDRHGYAACDCGEIWTGHDACHCPGCHQTFTNDRAFAKHRLRGRCHAPETRGLVKVHRAHWTGWGFPAQLDRLERVG